jgi:hypothetical protein
MRRWCREAEEVREVEARGEDRVFSWIASRGFK